MTLISCKFGTPGRIAPAFLFGLAATALSLAVAAPYEARAQSVVPPPSLRPVPEPLEMNKLVWSTMLAVDHANRSGNYSVLRDMAAQGFQINNDPARLAQVFASLRDSRLDLSNTLIVAPTYFEAPRLVQDGVFEVKGVFQLRPSSVQFDLFYQWEQGRWKLFGIDIKPVTMAQTLPGAAPPANRPPAQQPSRRR